MKRFILGCVLAAATAGSAQAGTCYQRIYKAEHLRENPDQTVTYLAISFERGVEITAHSRVRFRDSGRDWATSLFCWQPDPARYGNAMLGCSVECDGGYFLVRERGDDAILVTTKGGWVVGPGGCGSDGAIRHVTDQGAAKTVFKLFRTDESNCR